jgi:hypothetical protein
MQIDSCAAHTEMVGTWRDLGEGYGYSYEAKFTLGNLTYIHRIRARSRSLLLFATLLKLHNTRAHHAATRQVQRHRGAADLISPLQITKQIPKFLGRQRL